MNSAARSITREESERMRSPENVKRVLEDQMERAKGELTALLEAEREIVEGGTKLAPETRRWIDEKYHHLKWLIEDIESDLADLAA